VLPFAIAPMDNPTTIPGPVDGAITITGGVQATDTTTTLSTSNARAGVRLRGHADGDGGAGGGHHGAHAGVA